MRQYLRPDGFCDITNMLSDTQVLSASDTVFLWLWSEVLQDEMKGSPRSETQSLHPIAYSGS